MRVRGCLAERPAILEARFAISFFFLVAPNSLAFLKDRPAGGGRGRDRVERRALGRRS